MFEDRFLCGTPIPPSAPPSPSMHACAASPCARMRTRTRILPLRELEFFFVPQQYVQRAYTWVADAACQLACAPRARVLGFHMARSLSS